MEKPQPSYTAGGNIKWCSHFGNSLAFTQKLNTELPYDAAISLVDIHPRELHKNLYANILSSITHHVNNSNGHQLMSG